MIRPFAVSLAVAATVSLATGGPALAAKKKSTNHAQMDGAILVVSAADGPMPAKTGHNGMWGGYLISRNGMIIVPMAHGVRVPALRVGR